MLEMKNRLTNSTAGFTVSKYDIRPCFILTRSSLNPTLYLLFHTFIPLSCPVQTQSSPVVTVQLCGRLCVPSYTSFTVYVWFYLVREVVAVHLVAVRLTSWTLNLNAMALQDGCFFKNTNAIIAYRPQNNNALRCKDAVTRSKTDEQEMPRSLNGDNHKQPIRSFALQVTHEQCGIIWLKPRHFTGLGSDWLAFTRLAFTEVFHNNLHTVSCVSCVFFISTIKINNQTTKRFPSLTS